MGSYKKGVMCTVFPTAYIDNENNIIYLDTQGFFGTEKIPEYEAAASILLDAAIKCAKTVKIVYLEDYNCFHEGYTGIAESIKLLNTTVKDFGIPIYCLFNKYHPSILSIWSYLEKSDEQKNDFICKKLVEDSKKVVSGVKTSYLNLIEHYKSCENIDDMIPKEKNDNSLELKGACLIEFNFKCGRFGYIDPTSEWSVNNLKNKIMKLPSIDKKGLSFNYSNENRINFEKEFESELRYKMIPILNDINFALKYPPDLINHLNDINALKIQKNCDLISLLEEGYEIDQENMDEIMKINENKKNELTHLIQSHSDKLESINMNIDRILSHPPVEYRKYHFDEPLLLFYYWRNHIVKHCDTVPIKTICERLMTGTIREKLINFDSSKYRESQENDGTTVFEIRDQNNPTFNFEASYSSMTLSQKIKTSIIVPSSFLVTMNKDKFFLALPLGMLLKYFLPECNNCSGVVTIFARYQDIEKEALENNKKEKRNLEQKIIKEKNELERINKSINEDKKKLLINHNEELNRNIKELQNITGFVIETLSKLNEKCENESFTNLNDKLAFYYQICTILYDESEQKESILDFKKVYEIMKNAKPKDQNINTIDIIDEFKLKNVNYLFPLNFDKTIKYFM